MNSLRMLTITYIQLEVIIDKAQTPSTLADFFIELNICRYAKFLRASIVPKQKFGWSEAESHICCYIPANQLYQSGEEFAPKRF